MQAEYEDPPNPREEEGIWERHYSPDDGMYYLFNPFTNECVWDDYNREQHDESRNNESSSVAESTMSLRSGINDPRLSVVERSNIMLELKKAKIAKFQQEKIIKEQSIIKGQPNITKKSSQLNRSVEDMYEWEKSRKQKLQKQAEARLNEESIHLTGRPTITKKAETLSRRRNEYGEPTFAQDIEESDVVKRLHTYEEKKQLKIQKIREAEAQQARLQSVPKISQYSRQLTKKNRDGQNISEDHLVALSRLQERTEQFLDGSRLETHDEFTGQRLFAPVLNRTSEKLASRNRDSNVPIEELLQQKGRLYRMKQEERERKKRLEDQRLAEIHKVNKVSEKIVQEKSFLTGETVEDRLNRPIGWIKQRTLESMEQPTFQPQISSHSMQILAHSGYSHRYFPQPEENNQLEYESFNDDEWDTGAVCVDGNEFTLLPRDNASCSSGQKSGPDSLYYRFTMWDEQRKRRLDLDRQHKERLEMTECSFKPRVTAAPLHRRDKSEISSSERGLSERHAEWMRKR